ncbi:MAG: ribonucleoside-triphosphate reductase, adenosylcobalamin-dependent [Nodosilinea sp. WJT8-NPBG4]|jgi:ribonucleotide reductase class II|nr:ribonucleoside-triphosphate reductase, adenosylcobalamin-dependent [Nodosilinea sp. WJT8-NPBG4]
MQKYINDADAKSASSTLPKFDFPASATTALPVVYRTYARKEHDAVPRESVSEVKNRVLTGLFELGNFTKEEEHKIRLYFETNKLFPSGRAMWCLGTEFSKQPENYYSLYNCNNIRTKTFDDMGDNFEFLMMGSGVGEILELDNVNELPPITSQINLTIKGEYGITLQPLENTKVSVKTTKALIEVGDSRQGWVNAYVALLKLAANPDSDIWNVTVDVSNIREAGKVIKGFGGRSNPVGFIPLLKRVVEITNNAIGRQLKPIEVSMLVNEAAKCTVAGNVRRSAKMQQFSQTDIEAGLAKTNLWTQDSEGNWKADSAKDALRMSNFTRVWHTKPTREDILEALQIQFNTAEGAIMYAPEAIARANNDILNTPHKKKKFITRYCQDKKEGELYLVELNNGYIEENELDHRMHRYGLNPCGEIIGSNYFCNLIEVHANQLDPNDLDEQKDVFYIAGLEVASLLHHEFTKEQYRFSREIDPIVGVSFTGLFDFFVTMFGVEWLEWWQGGRSRDHAKAEAFLTKEAFTLTTWKNSAEQGVSEYCKRNGLNIPNRFTTVQPAGTKSLLTGASPGWHPPKSSRYIRRITFAKNDPVALACIDYGYPVVPSQSNKDEAGNLLNDPFDPRCTEWLVEIPFEMSWANDPGCDQINPSKFSVKAQFDFYMQVQNHYTTHNTSATLEYRESEIEEFADILYQTIQEDTGYISAAMMARFDANETMPRLPFEPISKERYEQLLTEVVNRRKSDDFYALLLKHDTTVEDTAGPSGCDSDKCFFPVKAK